MAPALAGARLMAGCAVSPAPDRFVSDVLGYLDCQAATLGSQGYLALAAPGSSVSLLLTALLTIAIALIGYRLLFGDTPGIREGVLTMAKIGIVLALATSWPAYRTVIFDVVLRTPAELAGEIGRPAGLPGASGGLAARMDGVDRSLRILSIYGVGVPTREQVEQANGVAPPLFANFDTFALGAARLAFLVGGLGAFALLRLSAGLLLALGPLFAVFLLFTATRGLAEGWLRGLTAATLGAAAVAVALGVELALLEPWLTDLVTQRAARIAIPGAPVALLATATIFALAIVGLLATITRVAFALRLPTIDWRSVAVAEQHASAAQALNLTGHAETRAGEQRSRALAIADSVVMAQRRDEQAGSGMTRAALVSDRLSQSTSGKASIANVPLGQGYRRRAARRVSSSAAARDRRS